MNSYDAEKKSGDLINQLREMIVRFRVELEEMRSSSKDLFKQLDESYAEIEKLKNENKRWRLAIEGCTPGGSEFYNDPERCAQYIRDARKFPQKMIRLMDENKSLKDVCKVILDDATGDVEGKKRLWPIRIDNWRRLDNIVGTQEEKDGS